MTTGSIGSHRAFMGVSLTLCALLVLILFVGWRFYYFEEVNRRKTLIDMAARDQARSADLEKMGLSIDAGKTEPVTGPDATHLVLGGQQGGAAPHGNASATAAPGTATSPPAESGGTGSYPAFSSIKETRLEETSAEVVQAVAVLDQYWAAPAWKDRQSLVVDAGRVAPLMRNFYETQKGADPVTTGLISKARYSIDDTEILYFRYNGNRSTGTVEVAMRRGDQGRFLIDWESLVGYGELSFEQLREQRPAKPVLLRVFARQFEYYNFEFADASRYYCVKLSAPNGENSIYAYAERGSPLVDWLSTSLAGTGPTATMGFTVKVAFPADAQSNQCVHLLQVVASRWLTTR